MITLKTLPEATAQQVFDQVARHLLNQNRRSAVSNDQQHNSCRYRGPNDTKCAAGCLIDDAEYTHDMEGCSWTQMVAHRIAPSAHQFLITALQIAHDSFPPTSWRSRLQLVARVHGLNTDVLQ